MRYILILILTILATGIKAQNKLYDFNANSYLHTISTEEHTVTFFVADAPPKMKVLPALTYYWYSRNQLYTTDGGFSGKLLHGRYTTYYTNRNLKEQGDFAFGLKNGQWNRWNSNGTLTAIQHYNMGILDGSFTEYNAEGKRTASGQYNNGQLDGKVLNHAQDTTIVLQYRNGKLLTNKPDSARWLNKVFKSKKQVQQ